MLQTLFSRCKQCRIVCKEIFGILTRFHETLLQSENLVSIATVGTKTALGVLQLWFNYFVASFIKSLAIRGGSSLKVRRGDFSNIC